MNTNYTAVSRPRLNALEANKVLKNTYLLLSATLAFSAVMAMVSMAINVPPMAYMISLIASMVLGIFVLPKAANSSAGIGVRMDSGQFCSSHSRASSRNCSRLRTFSTPALDEVSTLGIIMKVRIFSTASTGEHYLTGHVFTWPRCENSASSFTSPTRQCFS